MKITINLTPEEVNAIDAYLREISPDINPKITKEDIKTEIVGIVSAAMQSGRLGDYYSLYCTGKLPKGLQ